MAAPGPRAPAGWAARLSAWLRLPRGLASRDMAVMCAFNALLHAKPSEPHLVPYLLQVKGFTGEAVWNDIFPVFTYSFFVFTLLAAPATQVFGCKPCIVAGALCRLATRFLLLYGHSLTSMRAMQVAYGAGVSAEVVFSAYVFARVGPELYQSATSATAAAALVGHLIADEAGQVAISAGASLTSLFYASLCTVAGGTALSLLLPSEPTSPPPPAVPALPPLARARATASRVARELKHCYSSAPLALLSAWWALGSVAGFYTEDYGTNLFADIDARQEANGHVTFVTRLLCTAAALLVIRLERPVAATGLWLYVAGTALAGVSIAGLASARGLGAAYAAYVAALTVLQFCTCALYAQCAHALDDAAAGEVQPEELDGEDGGAKVARKAATAPKGRAAVLFGANQTVALALQAAIQAFATTTRAPPRTQFAALAGYCFGLAGLTACAAAAMRLLTGTWRLVRDVPWQVSASPGEPPKADGAAGDSEAETSCLVTHS